MHDLVRRKKMYSPQANHIVSLDDLTFKMKSLMLYFYLEGNLFNFLN